MKTRKNLIRIWLIAAGLVLSILLEFIAITNYHQSIPVAEENLRGLALSLSSAIESISMKDRSLKLLESLQSPDIAFFSVMDQKKIILFHSNPELIGTVYESPIPVNTPMTNGFSESRITLGTGEEAYEFLYPLHVQDNPLLLRLVLHAHRSDMIVGRARTGMISILSLLTLGWILGILLYVMGVKAEKQRKIMEKKENLARLGTMGAVLAHEVRNPLAGIKGYAQLISERLKEKEEADFAGLIVKETVRLESLVNDLLEYVREEKPEINSFRADESLCHAISLVSKEAKDKNISIEKSIKNELMVSGNNDRFLQVILNICRNAIQSMPEGGVLCIGTEQSETHTQITISDTGPGIDEEQHEKIFEPFYTTRARGSGFGLALCRKYMESMNGSIRVFSAKGQGSKFVLFLESKGKKGHTP